MEMAEDYVELIADLIDAPGEARAADIARRLGVPHPAVVKAIGRLQKDGLVESLPYRSIFLTETEAQWPSFPSAVTRSRSGSCAPSGSTRRPRSMMPWESNIM